MSKTALITGASAGIGAQTALYFAQKGYSVAINYCKSREKAEKLKNEIEKTGVKAEIYKADVKKSAEVNAMVESVIKDFKTLDVLVNNAGISRQKLFTDITDDEWNDMISTNLSGVFYAARAALKHMIPRHSGNIVNISSIWGVSGASCEVHYSAAKGGVISLTKALAKEVAPSNIRVNCVAPGVIMTDMCRCLGEETLSALKDETPLCRLGTPLDIARVVYFLASEEAGFITGQTITADGGFL